MTNKKRPPGRPKTVPDDSERINVYLTPEQINKVKAIGKDMSDGIRKAIDAYVQRTE